MGRGSSGKKKVRTQQASSSLEIELGTADSWFVARVKGSATLQLQELYFRSCRWHKVYCVCG